MGNVGMRMKCMLLAHEVFVDVDSHTFYDKIFTKIKLKKMCECDGILVYSFIFCDFAEISSPTVSAYFAAASKCCRPDLSCLLKTTASFLNWLLLKFCPILSF